MPIHRLSVSALLCCWVIASTPTRADDATAPPEATGNWLVGACSDSHSQLDDAEWRQCITIVVTFINGMDYGTGYVVSARKHTYIVDPTSQHPSWSCSGV